MKEMNQSEASLGAVSCAHSVITIVIVVVIQVLISCSVRSFQTNMLFAKGLKTKLHHCTIHYFLGSGSGFRLQSVMFLLWYNHLFQL